MDFIDLDYTRLKDFLSVLKRHVEEHDSSLQDVKLIQTQHADALSLQGKEIGHLNELAIGFTKGLDELHAMSDKVSAWSERFRLVEERNYQFSKDINDVRVNLQYQIDDLQSNFESESADLAKQLKAEIIRKHGEGEKNMTHRCKALEEELEALRTEQRIGIERVQRDLLERLQGVYEFMQTTDKSLDKSPSLSRIYDALDEAKPTATSEDQVQGTPAEADTERPVKLDRMTFLPPPRELSSAIQIEPRARDDTLVELSHKFAFLTREVASLRRVISSFHAVTSQSQEHSGEPSLTMMDRTASTLQRLGNIPISEADLLLKLKEAVPAVLHLETRVENLTETVNSIATRTTDTRPWQLSPLILPADDSQAGVISRPYVEQGDQRRPEEEAHKSVESVERGAYETEALQLKLTEVCETLNKVLRTMPYKVDIGVFEGLSEQVKHLSKGTRGETRSGQQTEDQADKLEELEHRLNKLSRQSVAVSSLVNQMSAELRKTSQEIIANQDTKIDRMSAMMTAIQNDYKTQLDIVVKTMDSLAAELHSKDTDSAEQYLKAQVLALMRSFQEIDGKVEHLQQASFLYQPQAFADEAGEEEGEVGEASLANGRVSLHRHQTILDQHEKIIRMLVSRVSSGTLLEETKSKNLGATEVLMHLEDLRAEMYEMQSKYDVNKTLSAKEIEKLNEIYSLLSTKSDRQELGRKVDKSELKRLERLLRKQIEQLNEALKKAEEAPQLPREDPFFLKKKLDLDCAACGQVLPNYHDHAQQFSPRERFPMRYALFGPGFSRLLASIVQNEGGGMSLHRSGPQVPVTERASGAASPLPLGSPRYHPAKPAKRRLPKLNL